LITVYTLIDNYFISAGKEDMLRDSYEAPVIERPTRADDLTVKMFQNKVMGQDRYVTLLYCKDHITDSKTLV